jgi:S-adenosylmethionine decarboxylase
MSLLQKSGIDKILPCMKVDDYLFDPCGYSMNGVLQNEAVDYGLVRSD